MAVRSWRGHVGRIKRRQVSRGAWPLSAHLLVLCLAILVPGIILGGLALWSLFAAERSKTETRLAQAVEDVADAVDREILGYTRVGESLAASPLLQSRNLAAFDLQARQMLGVQGWFVMLADPTGQQVVNTFLPAGSTLPKVDPERIRMVAETGRPRATDLFFAAGKRPAIGVQVPVTFDGETAYVLTIAVPAEVLTPLLDQSMGEMRWTLEIADGAGRVVARSQQHAENVGRQTPKAALGQLKWRVPVSYLQSDGDDLVRIISRSALTDWMITALVPGSELARMSRQGWRTFAALAVGLTALSIILAYLFARRIAQPIQRLANIPLEGRGEGLPVTRLEEANQVGAALAQSIRELEASEERYRTLIEAANDIIYTTDLDGRFLSCNAAGYRALGYEKGDLIGRPLSSLLVGDANESAGELLAASENGQTREIEILSLSGKPLMWEVSSRLVRTASGRPEAVLSIARDITERKRAEEELRTNEERLRMALAGIGAGVWDYDFSKRSGTWSPEMMELYGLSGRTRPPSRSELLSLIHPEDRQRVRLGSEEGIRRGGPFAAEFRVQRSDGRLVWISSRGVVEHGPDGRPVRARGIDQDVTAARLAEILREQLLRTTAEQRDELESLYNSATIGLALLDRELRFQRINSVLAEMIGLPIDAYIGKHLWDVVPSFRSAAEPPIGQVLETGEPLKGVEIAAETASRPGMLRTWLLQFYPLKSPDGIVIGIGVISEEVTERRLALLGQAHLAAIVESSSDAIISWSMDGQIRSWNPGAERLFGYSAAEAIGQKVGLIGAPESDEPPESIFSRARAGEDIMMEGTRRRRDGTDIPVSISASPMRDSTGRIVAVSVIYRDISELRRREEHTRFIMRELSHRSKNLLAVIQAMARQTARTSRDLGDFQERFTARVKGLSQSHDLLVRRDWRGVPVHELVRAHVSPFVDRSEQAMILSGPSLILKPEAAQNLGLALHELATNASKHGALSSPTGRIEIRWGIEQRGGERRFRIDWQEGGGPKVAPPDRRGFGHSVVDAMVGRALDGEARLDWRPEGLAWSLDVPGACIAPESIQVSSAELPEGLPEDLRVLGRRWEVSARTSGRLPRLDEIDLGGMEGTDRIFIAAVDQSSDPVQFSYLHIGETLLGMFGHSGQGAPLWKSREQVLGLLEVCYRQAVATGRPCHDWARVKLDEGRTFEFERLLLPFSDDGKRVSHIVGMAVLQHEPAD